MKNDDKCGVYQIVCKTTGKRYIGSTARSFSERFTRHKIYLKRGDHHCKYLQNSWNLYGKDDFLFLIVDILPKEECSRREQQYFDIVDRNSLFNSVFFAILPNAEAASKRSAAMTGFRHTDKTKQIMSEKAKNRDPISEETRQKMREIAAKRPADEVQKRIIARRNRPLSTEETKLKMSKSQTGKKASEETLEKLRTFQRARVHNPASEDTKKKMSDSANAKYETLPHTVMAANVVTGEIVTAVNCPRLAIKIGCSGSTIANNLLGISKRNLINKLWKITAIDPSN